jgi:hypothetical protein
LFFADGELSRTAADKKEAEIQLESDYFEKSTALHYQANGIFFIGSDEDTSGVYMKPVKHNMKTSNLLV